MAADYKYRARARKTNRFPVWKWLAVGALIAVFAAFLSLLRDSDISSTQSVGKSPPSKTGKKPNQRKKPEFQFYTILEQEQEIPDYEIKILKREEKLGRAKQGRYVLQAGSFQNYKEADRRKAQLALLGVEARIEKTKIGDRVWNRVKVGPLTDMVSVDNIRSRLRNNSIDVVVLKADIQ